MAESVEKRFDSIDALRGVSLSVKSGEVFAVVGPNGAGKTTFVRCLSGTTGPTSGTITLFDSPPAECDPARIGLLPQDFTPPERLTPTELIDYYGGLYDAPRSAEAVLTKVGLIDSADVAYRNLSGGQRRRTLVGIAIVNDPDILFLDEPTTGIDPAGRREVWALIETLTAGGATVFLTSHDMAEVQRLADRIGVLVDGRMADVGTTADLLEAHGGESRLRIEATSIDTIGDSLAGYPVTKTDDGLTFKGVSPDAIGPIFDALRETDVNITAIVWREPDLEDVYLGITREITSNSEPSATRSVR